MAPTLLNRVIAVIFLYLAYKAWFCPCERVLNCNLSFIISILVLIIGIMLIDARTETLSIFR